MPVRDGTHVGLVTSYPLKLTQSITAEAQRKQGKCLAISVMKAWSRSRPARQDAYAKGGEADALTTASRSSPSSSSWRTCHARVAGKALPEDSMMMRSGAYCSVRCRACAYPGHISSVSLHVRWAFTRGMECTPWISKRALRICPTSLRGTSARQLSVLFDSGCVARQAGGRLTRSTCIRLRLHRITINFSVRVALCM